MSGISRKDFRCRLTRPAAKRAEQCEGREPRLWERFRTIRRGLTVRNQNFDGCTQKQRVVRFDLGPAVSRTPLRGRDQGAARSPVHDGSITAIPQCAKSPPFLVATAAALARAMAAIWQSASRIGLPADRQGPHRPWRRCCRRAARVPRSPVGPRHRTPRRGGFGVGRPEGWSRPHVAPTADGGKMEFGGGLPGEARPRHRGRAALPGRDGRHPKPLTNEANLE